MGRIANDIAKIRKMMGSITKKMPANQRALLEESGAAEFLARSFTESFRQGSRGPAWDPRLYAGAWEFDLSQIAMDNPFLWHGVKDVNVPVAMGRAVAEALPHCKAVFYPEDDHYSIIFGHMDEIMGTLRSVS
jgi:hypothetical protein